ncbi:MAG: hypothetical protein HGB26_01505 [Desulfobulbaceae bacterium]|nr:hypothetical protein [Desulfobulbaceae bacterium]
MTRLHPEDIQAIAERVVLLLQQPERKPAPVIPIGKRIEIQQRAAADMAAKLRGRK